MDISVQTDLMGNTRDQGTQTEDLPSDSQSKVSSTEAEEAGDEVKLFQFELTVTGLACHAVKQSLYEILQEEVDM